MPAPRAVIPAPPAPPIPVPLPNVPSGPIPADAVGNLFGHYADGPGDAGGANVHLQNGLQQFSNMERVMSNGSKMQHDLMNGIVKNTRG